MPRRVAIIQSSYIPWRGYFSIIARCDVFIFLDSVQFTRRDWRTRNRIKSPDGPRWLSIPVRQKGNYHASIDSIEIADPDWAFTHLRGIETSYRRAPYFEAVFPALRQAFLDAAAKPLLSEANQALTAALLGMLGITTTLSRDADLLERGRLDALDPTRRLVELAAAVEATSYLSGPAARSYLDPAAFTARGISVEWMDYAGLPEYPQLWGPFDPALSIVDALLNLGFQGARAVLDA